MKRSLVTILAVVMVAAFATSSFAQNAGPRSGAAGQQGGQRQGGGPGAGGFRMSPELTKKIQAAQKKVLAELKLTADQSKKVAAAEKKRTDSMGKLRTEMTKAREAKKEVDRTAMQAKFKKISDTYTAEMKKAMGNDKYARYDKRMKEEMKKIMDAEMKKNGGAAGGRPGGNRTGGGKAGGA